MRASDFSWQSGCGPPSLSASEVHLWSLSLEQPPERIRVYLDILCSEEKRRAEGRHLRRDRDSFCFCRGYLRMLIGRYGGVAPAKVRFTTGDHGKLSLDPDFHELDIGFNVSHSGRIAMIALAKQRRLGVDVQRVRGAARIEEISRGFFSSLEDESIRALPEEMRVDAFYACWTRKEAAVKALGGSIAALSERVIVSADPGGPPQLLRMPSDLEENNEWRLHDLPVREGYAAALCYSGSPAEVFLWQPN
jgi:4'-phosphopantetheinyl transferase